MRRNSVLGTGSEPAIVLGSEALSAPGWCLLCPWLPEGYPCTRCGAFVVHTDERVVPGFLWTRGVLAVGGPQPAPAVLVRRCARHRGRFALGTRGASWKRRGSRLGRERTVTRWLSALGGQCPSFPEWKQGQAKGRSFFLPPFHGPLACRVGNGQNGTHVTKPRQARSFPNTASSAPATAPRLCALTGATGHVRRRKRRTVRLTLIHSGSVSF